MNRVQNRRYLIALAITATCGLALSGRPVSAQVTNFNDAFGAGSTLNAAPTTPTATSTSYEAGFGSTGGSSSIASGDLKLTLPTTSSVLAEIAAQFGTAPITLATVGDYIDLQVTWVNTANIYAGNATAGTQVALGLYNSGGSAPQQGTVNFNSVTSPTGGAQNWEGYFGTAIQTSNSKVVARPKQTSATSAQNQELLFNNASSSQAFNSPQGGQLTSGTKPTTNAEPAGTTLTSEFRITLTGANSLSVSNMLFLGAGNGGTQLFAENGTTNGVTDLSFDGLAFGTRFSGTSASAVLDINSILVTSGSAVPEPSTLALIGSAIALIPILRRRRR